MRRILSISLLLAPLVAALPLLPVGGTARAEIMPHEARYDLKLDFLKIDGYPLESGGAMAFRLTRDCQKWEMLQELRFSVGLDGAPPIKFHLFTRVLEGLDGKRMEFTGWQSQGGGQRADIRGAAKMSRTGFGGKASFRQPEPTEWDLPSPTQLPIAAMRDLVDALVNGRPDPQSIAFEVLGISEVTGIAPGEAVDLDNMEARDRALVGGRSWRVDKAVYFEAIAQNDPFLMETLQIHQNGVVSKFWHEYETMVLTGELVAITELPTPEC